MKPILFNLSPIELERFVLDIGQPKFRAKQIREWLARGVPDFASMKNLPGDLRMMLDETAVTMPCRIIKKLESSDGATTKFLLQMMDGEAIETVLMRTTYGNSVCVSSQAGCAMGCKFCASTLLGLKRNLTSNEMIAQVLVAAWELKRGQKAEIGHKAKGIGQSVTEVHDQITNPGNKEPALCLMPYALPNTPKNTKPGNKASAPYALPNGDAGKNDVSHIVVMGTGEPLLNFDNLREFLEYANSALGISWRKITVSTCGIIPGIEQLTEWGKPVNLAISLHAPNDTLRGQLMPINAKYPLGDVMAAAYANTEKTGRQLMIEYILLGHKAEGIGQSVAGIHDQNTNLGNKEPALCPMPYALPDTPKKTNLGNKEHALCPMPYAFNYAPQHAAQLAELLRGHEVMVNLIPWNSVSERQFTAPSGNAVHRFQDALIAAGIHTRIRRERGGDIGSACGQLRLGAK